MSIDTQICVASSPVISVVMCAYNAEKYICEAIDSILAQSFENFEFTIVDDGSTDGTEQLIKNYQDCRIRLIQRPHSGLTKSLNYALSHISGEFVARMDADDRSHPERLQRQYSEFMRKPFLSLLGTWSIQIDSNGSEMRNNPLPFESEKIQADILQANPFVHGSMMIRKTVLDAVDGYRDDFIFSQDYDLALRLSANYELANLPAYLYYSRHNKTMISVTYNSKQLQFAELARTLHRQRLREGVDDLQLGTDIAKLLPAIENDHQGEIMYYQQLLSAKCRRGQTVEARMAVFALLKLTPFSRKLWAIGLVTFFGPTILRIVMSYWDRRSDEA